MILEKFLNKYKKLLEVQVGLETSVEYKFRIQIVAGISALY